MGRETVTSHMGSRIVFHKSIFSRFCEEASCHQPKESDESSEAVTPNIWVRRVPFQDPGSVKKILVIKSRRKPRESGEGRDAVTPHMGSNSTTNTA